MAVAPENSTKMSTFFDVWRKIYFLICFSTVDYYLYLKSAKIFKYMFCPISPRSQESIWRKNNPIRSLIDTHLCTKSEVNSSTPSKVIEGTNRPTDRPTEFFFFALISFSLRFETF